MNTQTISTIFMNTHKVHDQLDTLRAQLNNLARDRGLDGAFDKGVLAAALTDTDLGRRYLSLTRHANRLAFLPDRRIVIAWTLVGAGIYLTARRRGWDQRARRAVIRAGRQLRARLPRRKTAGGIPPQFTVTPAAATAYKLAGSDSPVTVLTPADADGTYDPRHGQLITLGDEYFALLVGEMPYLFLPDQVAQVGMTVDANGNGHRAVITLTENPVAVPDLS